MIKNITLYSLASIIAGIFSTSSTFLLTHLFSPAEYAKGMLCLSCIGGLFYICCPGMNRVFMRFFFEKEYISNTSLLLYRCLTFITVNIFIVSLILFFLRNILSNFFGFSKTDIWLLLTSGVIINILLNFASLIPKMRQDGKLFSIGEILTPALFLLFITIISFTYKKNAFAIIISQFIAMTTTFCTLCIYYKNHWIPKKNNQSMINAIEIKKFICYGFPFIISSGMDWVFFNLDKFLILKWSNYFALGIYTAAFTLSSLLETCKSVFTSAWIPRCNQVIVEQPFKGKKIFYDTFHMALWSFTAITLVILSLKPILILFLGKAYRQAGDIFGWLLLGVYFYALSEIVVAGILKAKKTYWNIIISILSLTGNIIACYYLIPRYGAEGAATANAFSFFIFFISRCYIAFRYYPFKIIWNRLFQYTSFISITIWVMNQHYIYVQYVSTILFLMYSLLLEKKRLTPLYRTICLKFERKPA